MDGARGYIGDDPDDYVEYVDEYEDEREDMIEDHEDAQEERDSVDRDTEGFWPW